jgi:hypothetical protein
VTHEIELDLESGGHLTWSLPPPGDFASFYFFSMEYSGSWHFWQLLTRLMEAAGWPICDIHAQRRESPDQGKITRAAWYQLLRRKGYGFGIFFDVDPALKQFILEDSKKLLLLRDPRDMVVSLYLDRKRKMAPDDIPAFTAFLHSDVVDRLVPRYRRLSELWYEQRDATLLRYENGLAGWHTIVADTVATLKLPIDPAIAAAIATKAPAIGDRLPAPDAMAASGITEADIAATEARFAELLPALGYAPRPERISPPP